MDQSIDSLKSIDVLIEFILGTPLQRFFEIIREFGWEPCNSSTWLLFRSMGRWCQILRNSFKILRAYLEHLNANLSDIRWIRCVWLTCSFSGVEETLADEALQPRVQLEIGLASVHWDDQLGHFDAPLTRQQLQDQIRTTVEAQPDELSFVRVRAYNYSSSVNQIWFHLIDCVSISYYCDGQTRF